MERARFKIPSAKKRGAAARNALTSAHHDNRFAVCTYIYIYTQAGRLAAATRIINEESEEQLLPMKFIDRARDRPSAAA